jgi:lipopolysaccharide transport system permease protein
MTQVLQPQSVPTPSVIGPVRRRLKLRELWTTRRVAWMIGLRDMRAKYKQAALGPLWLLIAPLGMLAAVSLAFSGVASVNTYGIPYVVFAICGLTVWNYIQLSLLTGTQAIVSNAQLVRRSPLPRVALMTGPMLGNLPPLTVMTTLTVVGAAVSGHLPPQAVLLPLLIGWLFLFTLGATLLISALSARFRDTVSAMPLIIQAGIFVSPVGYGLEGAPAHIHTLLLLNPVTGLIEAWRWALLGLPNPSIPAMVIAGVWTLVLTTLGWRVFGRMEVEMADYV